jgi:hypothetical protein
MDEKNDPPSMIHHYRRLTKTILVRYFGKPGLAEIRLRLLGSLDLYSL